MDDDLLEEYEVIDLLSDADSTSVSSFVEVPDFDQALKAVEETRNQSSCITMLTYKLNIAQTKSKHLERDVDFIKQQKQICEHNIQNLASEKEELNIDYFDLKQNHSNLQRENKNLQNSLHLLLEEKVQQQQQQQKEQNQIITKIEKQEITFNVPPTNLDSESKTWYSKQRQWD